MGVTGRTAIIGVVLAMASLRGAYAADLQPSPTLIRPNLIAIDGARRLNLVCVGEGSPTVVFLQGAGSHIPDWGKVQPAISRRTRACFYDRAGYGFSDPANRPMTLSTVVEDLRALLGKAHIAPPYVLVGHSVGGFYATYYADLHRSELAGMVLVDPAFAGVYEFARSAADRAAFEDLVGKTFGQVFDCTALARAGKLTAADPHGCFMPAPTYGVGAGSLVERFSRPALYDAELLEIEATSPIGDAVPVDAIEERAAARSFGALPLIVLTAGEHTQLPGLSASGNGAFKLRWREGHRELAARSAQGTQTVVEGASHFIQFDRPDVVIGAIDRVLDLAGAVPPRP